jgi:hypothetical protein
MGAGALARTIMSCTINSIRLSENNQLSGCASFARHHTSAHTNHATLQMRAVILWRRKIRKNGAGIKGHSGEDAD